MPTYELAFLLRAMPRPDIISTLRRSADSIFQKGGIIRKIENLGFKKMPYRTSSHGAIHHEANYFVIHFDVPPASIFDLNEEYGRDVDIIRRRIYKQVDEPTPACTLADEIKPPVYRNEVQKMMAIARRDQKPKFRYNTGLDYYPFQK